MKKRSLYSTAILYMLGSFFIQGITFFTLPIFSKILSPSDFGLLASYNFWITIISIFIGLKMEGTINNAKLDFGLDGLDDYCKIIVKFSLIPFVSIIVVSVLCKTLITYFFEITFLALFIGVLQSEFNFIFTVLVNKQITTNRPVNYLVFSIANALLNIIFSIVFVMVIKDAKYFGRVIASFITALIVGSAALYILYKEKSGYKLKPIDAMHYSLKLSLPLILHALSGIILSRSDQMMLLKLNNADDAGIYSFACNFGNIISVLYLACNQAFVPWYYERKKKKDELTITVLFNLYTKSFLMIYIAFICVLPEVMRVMGSSSFKEGIYVAPLIGLGFFFCYLYSFPVNYEFYHKQTKFISFGTVFTAIVNIIFNFILIPCIGGIGAAIATVFSCFVLLVMHYFIATRIIRNYEFRFKSFIFPLLSSILITSIYYVILDKLLLRYILLGITFLIYLIFLYTKFKVNKKLI